MRYMVIPMPRQPPGTASAPEEDLVRLITRDSLIGRRARLMEQPSIAELLFAEADFTAE